MAEPEFMQMGKAFVGFYYPEFSKDRSATSALAAVYTEQSCLTFEGAQFQGKAPILEKLASLPFTKVCHQVTTIDAQPIIGVDDNKAVVVMVTGQLKTDDDPPHSFHHSFMLRPAGGAFVISNEVFRLALHN
ncbi:unnamed protein product [Oikopleura dioica]|uniref:NTF2-related export protein n=1 Tax=Oikopleura dioica TaxID=34765 RepID=E4XBJ0_OIKDI|nr:unnamed protein product [Oikopleura dioica]CBY34400.1 unnamed protein product [Oikopleura dioica]